MDLIILIFKIRVVGRLFVDYYYYLLLSNIAIYLQCLTNCDMSTYLKINFFV